ncbi:hypothetical protein MKX01_014820 [Papaver californicum]|nr:hypothetical protein MKX01_014820 [Papaver californicum]
MGTCFFSKYIKDIKPKALNYRNIYQLIEVLEQKHGGFIAKSVAPDGIPPEFLRESGWNVHKSDSKLCQLTEASGLNFSLRNLLPDFDFPMRSQNSSAPVTIGKWYCLAVFIRDHGDLRHRIETSLFYEMTLEQFWEAIYKCENDYYSPNNVVAVSTSVKKETMKLLGMEATIDNNIDVHGNDGIQWIRNELNNILGLNIAIVEKMKWIQDKGGFMGGSGERDTRVEHVEEFKQGNGWERFGCFVLVESFVLKTMSGAVVFTCDYKHIHQLQCKWE